MERSHVDHIVWHGNGVSGCPDTDAPGIVVVMYVVKVPNRGSPPAILLRESYREAGKVKNRTLANLSAWPEAKVDALAQVLKGQPPPAAPLDEAFEITRSLPHGHVAAVLGTARQLGLDELIDPVPSRHRDLVTAMAVAQVIAPDSKLAIARGLRQETAATSLGEVLHLGRVMRMTCTRRWTTCTPGRTRSRTRSPHGTWPAAPWCCMTSRPPRSRGGPARWAPSATPKTGSGAGCRSSTGCSPPLRASRSRSRSSRATPATRRPWPRR